MHDRALGRCAALIGAIMTSTTLADRPVAWIVEEPALPNPAYNASAFRAINAHGDAVGYVQSILGDRYAAYWSKEHDQMERIWEYSDSGAYDMTDGAMTVWVPGSTWPGDATLWRVVNGEPDGTVGVFRKGSVQGALWQANGINADRRVAGWYRSANPDVFRHPVVWITPSDEPTPLAMPDGRPYGITQRINSDGVICGAAWAVQNGAITDRRAVVWLPEQDQYSVPVILSTLEGDCHAADLNDLGIVVGYSIDADDVRRAVKWLPDGQIVDLGVDGYASGISDGGTIVGTAVHDDRSHWPFVHDADGTTVLRDHLVGADSYVEIRASDINEEREVAGFAVDAAGGRHGVIIRPMQPVLGDVDGNGVVDVVDLLLLLDAWGPCAGCPADLDGDGLVGTSDLLVLLGAW